MNERIPTLEDIKRHIIIELLSYCYKTKKGTCDIPLSSIDLLCQNFEGHEEYIVQEASYIIEHMNEVYDALKAKSKEAEHWQLAYELINTCVRQHNGMKYINFLMLEKKLKACTLTLCQRKMIMQSATTMQMRMDNLQNK